MNLNEFVIFSSLFPIIFQTMKTPSACGLTRDIGQHKEALYSLWLKKLKSLYSLCILNQVSGFILLVHQILYPSSKKERI